MEHGDDTAKTTRWPSGFLECRGPGAIRLVDLGLLDQPCGDGGEVGKRSAIFPRILGAVVRTGNSLVPTRKPARRKAWAELVGRGRASVGHWSAPRGSLLLPRMV